MRDQTRYHVGKRVSFVRDYPEELSGFATKKILMNAEQSKVFMYRMFLVDYDREFCHTYGHARRENENLTEDQISKLMLANYTMDQSRDCLQFLLKHKILDRDENGAIWHPSFYPGL